MEEKRPESAASSRVARSRKGKGVDKTWIERRERRKISFKKRRPNIIGKNDPIVNTHLNKIKLETVDDMQGVVKEENDDIMESVDVEMEDIARINEEGRVPMEYAKVRVVTDETESPILNERTNNQDSSSSNNLQDIHKPEDPSDPASGKTAGHLTETVYEAKFLSLRRRYQRLLRTLKQNNSVIRVLTEKIQRLELQLSEATSKIVTVEDKGTTMSAEVGTEEVNDLQSSVCRVNQEISCQSVPPGPLPTEAENIQREMSRSRSVSPNYALVETEMAIEDKEGQNKAVDVFEQVVRILIQNGIQTGQVKCTDKMFKKCRLVCKNWKESVDRALKNDPSHMALCSDGRFSLFKFKKDFTPPCSTIIRKDSSVNQKFSKTCWRKLQSYVVDYPSFNAIINGHLMIDVDHKVGTYYKFDQYFWFPFADLVHDFLEAFGAKVFYLTVRFRLSLNDAMDRKWRLEHMNNSFVKWLHLTPNVKSLCMEFDMHGDMYGDTGSGYESIICLRDVPHMKDLTVIQNSMGLVLHGILARNQQICRLHLDYTITEIHQILELNFPNLSELVIYPRTYFGSDVPKLKSVMWPVQRLTLIDRWASVVSNVLSSKIKNTLQYLTLEGLRMDSLLFDLDTELDLPVLTHLKFRICLGGFDGEDLEAVLKQLKLLETVEVELISTGPYHFGIRLEWYDKFLLGVVKVQSKASYWKVLPKLKRIEFIHLVTLNGSTLATQKKVIKRDDLPAERVS